jgi:prepilin-type N-terminal cleavage/methylation domain-containing protein
MTSTRQHRQRGLTLVEILAVLAIASIFLVGIVSAISAVLGAAEQQTLKAEAHRNGRNALQIMAKELSEANTLSSSNILRLEGLDAPQTTGDFRDNDLDGRTDEEAFDGNDNDFDRQDVHVRLDTGGSGGVFERPRFTNAPDLGDIGVDEDVVFQRDSITFVNKLQRITYRIATFEGEPNVLLRRTRDLITPVPIPPPVEEPIAFNVLSLNFLYFDPNWITTFQPQAWTTSWDSRNASGPIPYPATIHMSISVYSGEIPLDEITPSPSNPLDVVTLETQVALEGVLSRYHANF